MELLNVTGLVKSYGGRRVVDDVSFSVNQAEVVGLLGKNGAGKTTTFMMTMGMIPREAGTIVFEGENISNLPMYRRVRFPAASVGGSRLPGRWSPSPP